MFVVSFLKTWISMWKMKNVLKTRVKSRATEASDVFLTCFGHGFSIFPYLSPWLSECVSIARSLFVSFFFILLFVVRLSFSASCIGNLWHRHKYMQLNALLSSVRVNKIARHDAFWLVLFFFKFECLFAFSNIVYKYLFWDAFLACLLKHIFSTVPAKIFILKSGTVFG